MSKFTKGKWEVVSNSIFAIEEDYHVCVIAVLFDNHQEEVKPNARLIAAAPEMYELLKEELIPTSDYGGIISFERERKIKELLARIDGEEMKA